MSTELLVLLVVFGVLPLLQRAAGTMRDRRGRPAGAGERPLPAPLPAPPAPLASARPVEPPPMVAPHPVQVGGHRLNLRHAVRLMAILGPCRAHRSYNWGDWT